MKVVEGTSFHGSDKELHDRMKSGSVNAYTTLFEQYWESLYAISVHITKDREVAKDVVQEVFLSFWENRRIKTIDNLGGYLSRATKFASLKLLRDDKTILHQSIDEASELASSEDSGMDAKELEEQLSQAIARLPVRCREVFVLSREEQLTNKEIAERLNLSQRTVETHISNALKELRSKLPKDLLLFALFSILQ